TEKAAVMPVPKDPKLKSPADFKLIGKPMQRKDQLPKAMGKTEFGIDVQRPNMLVATVAKCPVFGGKVQKMDAAAAQAVKGVKKVIPVSSGAAVVAENFWAAKKGVEALAITWEDGPGAGLTSQKIAEAAAAMAKKPGVEAEKKGDVEKALK